LPDGLFSDQNSKLGKFWRALQWKMYVSIFYEHLTYFVVLWHIFPHVGKYTSYRPNEFMPRLKIFTQILNLSSLFTTPYLRNLKNYTCCAGGVVYIVVIPSRPANEKTEAMGR
jgi:hypothetical protein